MVALGCLIFPKTSAFSSPLILFLSFCSPLTSLRLNCSTNAHEINPQILSMAKKRCFSEQSAGEISRRLADSFHAGMHSVSINASSGTPTLPKYEKRARRLQTRCESQPACGARRRHAAAMSVAREIHSLPSPATAGKLTLSKLCNFHPRKKVGSWGFFSPLKRTSSRGSSVCAIKNGKQPISQ